MTAFGFWIVSPDVNAAARWRELAGEWNAEVLRDLAAFSAAAARKSGLALIDRQSLPSPPGEALRGLKARLSKVALLLVSRVAVDDREIIALLKAGAEDFFPCTMHERIALAKLKAHMRRLLPNLSRTSEALSTPAGDIRLDKARRRLWLRRGSGKWLSLEALTSTEFEILTLLLERPGIALERRFILDTLRPEDGRQIFPGTIDKHVESLRKKLGNFGVRIQTVFGVGYAYREGSARRGA